MGEPYVVPGWAGCKIKALSDVLLLWPLSFVSLYHLKQWLTPRFPIIAIGLYDQMEGEIPKDKENDKLGRRLKS